VRALRIVLLVGVLLGTRRVAADSAIILEPDGAIVTSCRFDVRLFRTLRHGLVDFCRGHLRYAPGTLDCYQFVDQVCTVWLPGSPGLTETRRAGTPSIFPCPPGREPPVCPRLTFR
jgi:hypothetical protein